LIFEFQIFIGKLSLWSKFLGLWKQQVPHPNSSLQSRLMWLNGQQLLVNTSGPEFAPFLQPFLAGPFRVIIPAHAVVAPVTLEPMPEDQTGYVPAFTTGTMGYGNAQRMVYLLMHMKQLLCPFAGHTLNG
jgi:hypothetical protein